LFAFGDQWKLLSEEHFQRREHIADDQFIAFEKKNIELALRLTSGRVSGPNGAAKLLDLNPLNADLQDQSTQYQIASLAWRIESNHCAESLFRITVRRITSSFIYSASFLNASF
jgi:hypothetical protein